MPAFVLILAFGGAFILSLAVADAYRDAAFEAHQIRRAEHRSAERERARQLAATMSADTNIWGD